MELANQYGAESDFGSIAFVRTNDNTFALIAL